SIYPPCEFIVHSLSKAWHVRVIKFRQIVSPKGHLTNSQFSEGFSIFGVFPSMGSSPVEQFLPSHPQGMHVEKTPRRNPLPLGLSNNAVKEHGKDVFGEAKRMCCT